MYRKNKKYEETVVFWNVPVKESGGNRTTPDSFDTTELNVLIMDFGMDIMQMDYGLVKYQTITFQVSKRELEDKEFDIQTGNTHFKYKNHDYIVDRILDYSSYPKTQLYQCVGLREIHAY